jgi:RNA polymerase sigma factor (sigma-70 family)
MEPSGMTDPRTHRRAPVPVDAAADVTDVFDAQRARLLSLAYRMLGSRAEAEDIVQDAWLKWHAADIAGETAKLREPAAWLTTIVTRLSIDRLRALKTERAAREHGWLPDPWIDAVVPSVEDGVLDGAQLSYGLMLLLERLSPDERAAFLLREAFDCDYATIGAALGKQIDHCRQLLHRAKARLAREGASEQQSKPADSLRQRHIVDALRDAIAAQDRESLLAVLDGARVVGDTPEPVLASVLASAGAHVETVSMGAQAAVALMADGDVRALCVPVIDASDRLTLYVVTRPSALAAMNLVFGRIAILELLGRISREARCLAATA